MEKPAGLPLGGMSLDTFFQEYWQQKPLLIKQAFPEFPVSLSADELAGFSLEEDCQARIVEQCDDNNWQVRHGPFSEDTFRSLSANIWSLLVQNVDAMDEEVNALLKHFRFLPNWRLDDIMVSFSSDKGGVGPHFDYYDVFLLQGSGKRRWRIGQHCDANTQLLPNQDMKILTAFECSKDWTVEQGDMIYIPAQIAHWGESIGESMTYSIGFRSPSHSELLLECTQTLDSDLNEDRRFRDGREIQNIEDPARLAPEAITQLQNTLVDLVNNPEAIGEWLGEFATQLKAGVEPEHLPLPFATLANWRSGFNIQLSSFNRAVYLEKGQRAQCFINGEKFEFSLETAKLISNYQTFSKDNVSMDDATTIEDMLTSHRLFVENES